MLIPLSICILLFAVSGPGENPPRECVLDVQGHRGCRGLMPENTIEAFLKALELGVTTLELDLVISKDNQVVVSHEPFFSHHISTGPNGQEITAETEKDHNIYLLTYDEIRRYDVGSKYFDQFPTQKKLKTQKPLFSEVLQTVEKQVEQGSFKAPYYNVEIKRNPAYDDQFHPDAKKFAKLVEQVIKKSGIKKNRFFIQSFDPESLRQVRNIDPEIKLVLLVANRLTYDENIEKLGFSPEVYSPYYPIVNENLVTLCKQNSLKLIPWTINDKEDMRKLIGLGVDGIITDYPDILINVLQELGCKVL